MTTRPVAASDGWLKPFRALRKQPWRPVLTSFVAARLVVAAALLVSRVLPWHKGRADLLGWDAAWYLRIAERGYAGVELDGHRFFPLLPLLARAFAPVLGGNSGLAMLVIGNAGAIVFALLAHRLALQVRFDRAAADRVPWVIAFTPVGFVFVMGYTESLFGMFTCLVLLAGRCHWTRASIGGYLAGVLRPTGVVLAVPTLIEALRGWRAAGARERLARTAAVAAPVLGLVTFLAWYAVHFGSFLRPLAIQTAQGLRGGVATDPVSTLYAAVSDLLTGPDKAAVALVHLPWIVAAVVLVVLARRVLPLNHQMLLVALVLLALTAQAFASFERYVFAAAPACLVIAHFLASPRRRVVASGLAVLWLFGYSLATFLGVYVP
jgi:hypothetical protein